MNPEQAAAAMESDGSEDLENTALDESDGSEDLESDGEIEAIGKAPKRGIVDRLLSTEPNPSLESVESPWLPDEGGASRIYRGIQKIGDVEGLPAIADILIGVLELLHDSDSGTAGDSETDAESDDSPTESRESHSGQSEAISEVS